MIGWILLSAGPRSVTEIPRPSVGCNSASSFGSEGYVMAHLGGVGSSIARDHLERWVNRYVLTAYVRITALVSHSDASLKD